MAIVCKVYHLVAVLYQAFSVKFSISCAVNALLTLSGGAVFQRAGLQEKIPCEKSAIFNLGKLLSTIHHMVQHQVLLLQLRGCKKPETSFVEWGKVKLCYNFMHSSLVGFQM